MPYQSNGDFEQLVEQITDVIYARLNGHADDQAQMCGCTSECFHRCPERMHRVVDAGAARIGLVLGQTASARDWASLIDHTLLKPDASQTEIKHLCEEAAQYHFASVCVNPTWVRACACHLQGSGVPVCTVIGFPLGATLPDVKAYEARRAIMDGAREVDMVINIGALKSGDDCLVEHDIRSVVEAYIEAAAAAGLCEVRLVHGRGRGVQRGIVQATLERHPLVVEFWDDTTAHLGATIARLETPLLFSGT